MDTLIVHYHDGKADFPHGAGASLPGWYVYRNDISHHPDGPYSFRVLYFIARGLNSQAALSSALRG